MIRRLASAVLALAAALALNTPHASAQRDAADPLGLGTKLGIQSLNGSGQVGVVTLFKRGKKTWIDVSMQGVLSGKTERVGIHRSRDCDAKPDLKPMWPLSDLHDGRSRTLVDAPSAKLLSGNYSVLVGSAEKVEHFFGCGHLYQ